MGDGGYMLNSWDCGKLRLLYFVVVFVVVDGIVDVMWNVDLNDDCVMSLFGCMMMKYGCWVNVCVCICVS